MIVKPPHEKIQAMQARLDLLKRAYLNGPRSTATRDALGAAAAELCCFIHNQQRSN